MADVGGIKQFTEEIKQAGSEVVKDVNDSVGQSLEQAAQSVVGAQLSSQQIQQQQAEDLRKITETRRILKWHSDIAQAQKKVSEEQKQKELQRLQEMENKKREKKIIFIEQRQQKEKILAPTPMSNIENKNKMAA